MLRKISSEAELGNLASTLATADGELILTTLHLEEGSLHEAAQLQLVQRWLHGLGSRAANAMIVGATTRTCARARADSVPCLLTCLLARRLRAAPPRPSSPKDLPTDLTDKSVPC